MDKVRALFASIPQVDTALLQHLQGSEDQFRLYVWSDDVDWIFLRHEEVYAKNYNIRDLWRLDIDARAPEVGPTFTGFIAKYDKELAEEIHRCWWGAAVRDRYLELYSEWIHSTQMTCPERSEASYTASMENGLLKLDLSYRGSIGEMANLSLFSDYLEHCQRFVTLALSRQGSGSDTAPWKPSSSLVPTDTITLSHRSLE